MTSLKSLEGVKAVEVLAAENSTILLPRVDGNSGSMVSKQLHVSEGDRLAIVSMYGLSNDWFFATECNGVDATIQGDISTSIRLYDSGTAANQFPGAGNNQANLGGTPVQEQEPIREVPNPNPYNKMPNIADMIKVTLQ